MQALKTNQLSKVYSGKIQALTNVTLSVDTGHVFGLLGPNGAGKTTLIKILLGIVRPTSGTACILEQPINKPEVKGKVGYLPENHRYPEFLKGGEILDYFGALAGVPKRLRETNKDRLLTLVNMKKWENTKIKKYSKGMLQRLGLAQAMINDPEILFLDEPTDGVDPIGRKVIRDILHRLQEEGKTIFLNSHLLSEVEMICDQVAILNLGNLLRTGTVKELTQPSKTYQLDVSIVSPASIDKIKKLTLQMSRENGTLSVTCSGQTELNGIIDILRNQQVDIKSIIPQKQSLEESFIEILKKGVRD